MGAGYGGDGRRLGARPTTSGGRAGVARAPLGGHELRGQAS